MPSASSDDWRCCTSKSGGTYSRSITGVIGSTLINRTVPPSRAPTHGVGDRRLGELGIGDIDRHQDVLEHGAFPSHHIKPIMPRIDDAMRPPASIGRSLEHARGDEASSAGVAADLAPVVDRKIDHRETRGRQLLLERSRASTSPARSSGRRRPAAQDCAITSRVWTSGGVARMTRTMSSGVAL